MEDVMSSDKEVFESTTAITGIPVWMASVRVVLVDEKTIQWKK
jgi:hypothetical protein